jgi:hypothetical protein
VAVLAVRKIEHPQHGHEPAAAVEAA